MKLEISRVDKTLPMPTYETSGACAFDLLVREDVTIQPHGIALVPSNLIVCVPEGYVLLLCSRSSSPIKKGLATPHGLGVIDRDYCGPTDELKTQVHNITDAPITVKRGEKISQALIVPAPRFEIIEIEPRADKSRGGFGTTG